MDKIIAQLLVARDTAHLLHLSSKRFGAHMALNELYDALVDLVDSLAEMHQGKYGILSIDKSAMDFTFSDKDAVSFLRELAEWAEKTKAQLPNDSFIQSEWDLVMAAIYKAKYKVDHLA